VASVVAAALIAVPPTPARASRDPHHAHADINARLAALVSAYPGKAHLHRVTTTPQGRDVLALEVDLDGRFAEDAPVLLVHGAIHGDEWLAAEVVLHVAELVLAADDGRLHGMRMHFIPVLNADGFDAGKRQAFDADGTWYDANRDFPVPYQPDHPSRALIAAFRDYGGKRGHLVAVLDYHTPAESISWPWACCKDKEPDGVAPLKTTVEEMARSVGFRFGQTARMISYKHQGTAQDYWAWVHKVPAVLLELGESPPNRDHLLQELIDQERPFLIYALWVRAGLASAPPAAGRSSSSR
jgi:predicted deacylase